MEPRAHEVGEIPLDGGSRIGNELVLRDVRDRHERCAQEHQARHIAVVAVGQPQDARLLVVIGAPVDLGPARTLAGDDGDGGERRRSEPRQRAGNIISPADGVDGRSQTLSRTGEPSLRAGRQEPPPRGPGTVRERQSRLDGTRMVLVRTSKGVAAICRS